MALAKIALSRGMAALVDAEDLARLSCWRWTAAPSYGRSGKLIGYYAKRSATAGGVNRTFYMHRVVLGVTAGLVDHRNGDKLDNRKANLRVADASENSINRTAPNPTGFRGVSREGAASYCAAIQSKNRVYRLGTFPDAERAARAYDDAARRLHGDFAVLNFPARA